MPHGYRRVPWAEKIVENGIQLPQLLYLTHFSNSGSKFSGFEVDPILV
jgi:hypothetical protein